MDVFHPKALRDDSDTLKAKELGGIATFIVAIVGACRVEVGCLEDVTREGIGGAGTISTSSSWVKSLAMSLDQGGGTLAMVEGAPIEGPEHDHLAIAFFQRLSYEAFQNLSVGTFFMPTILTK